VHVQNKASDGSWVRWKCVLTESENIENPLRHLSITFSLALLMMIVITVSPIALVKAPTSGTLAFTTSGLAGTAGITCPNSNGNCYNNAAECNTWLLNPTGASVPGDDRPWIAAEGTSKVCVSYHSITATNDIFVTCSNDAGLTFAQTGNAFDANHLWLAGFQNAIGNLAIDPTN